MRNYGLAFLGLIFVVSCSEEDPRIDISYTGEQLRSVIMPVGGVETGHMLINGDGSICAFNLFGTPDSDGQESSMTFFSLYAAEEGGTAVIRTLGRGLFNDSAGFPGFPEDTEGGESAGSSTGSEGIDSLIGSVSSGRSKGSKGLDNSRGSKGAESSGSLEGTERPAEEVRILEAVTGFREAVFHNAYPLVQVDLLDDEVPLQVTLSAWSPFIPLDILDSNLPVAVFEWELTNPGKKPVSYSLALAMQNPPGLVGQNGRFSPDEFAITHNIVSGWKGFTFSNGEGNSSMPGTAAVSTISSADNTLYVPLIGDRQKALEQFWTDFSTDGKLKSRGDLVGSSGRLESRDNTVNSSGRMEPDSDPFSSSSVDPEMAALYSTGVLDPGETVTIPFLFSWYVPFGHAGERLATDIREKETTYKKNGIPFDDKPLTSGAEDKLSAICSEDKASRSESKPLASSFKSIDDITGYMVSGYESLRDKTIQFSHSMITSTISPGTLDTVLSGFADAVGQRDGNTEVISNPFPDKETNGISVADLSAWDIYHATSGFAYNEEERVMKFSPATDVLPVRFFWATQSGWGTINVSRARIVLDCIFGSLNLKRLLLEGRSFFVFREFVPSQEANITYDNESLIINFTEKSHITEGISFTMEIP